MLDAVMRFMLDDAVMLSLIFIPAILLLVLGYVLIVRPLREVNRPSPDDEQAAAPNAAGRRKRAKESPFNRKIGGG